jgi:ATP-binding cassette subfamily B protein
MPAGVGRIRFYDESLEKPQITRTMLARILKYFIPYWKQMLVAVSVILISSVLGLAPSIFIKSIVDQALPHRDLKLLVWLIAISILITILLGLLQVYQTYLNNWIAIHIIFQMKNQMYQRLQHMSLSFFSSVMQGEIITRLTSDIDGIQDIFNTTVVNALSSIFVLAATAVALLLMNWKLAILGLCVLPLYIVPTRRVGKARWAIASQSQAKVSELNQIIQETLSISGAILSKIFTREKDEYKKFVGVNEEVTELQIKESLAGRWLIMTVGSFTTIGPMLIYLYGGYLFIRGEITIGAIIAFVALLGRLYGPVTQLSNIGIDVTRSFALFQRIFDYFDQKQEIVDRQGALKAGPFLGQVDFDHVHFSYNEKSEALTDLSFSVQPGSMVALVGASGAGKTTITYLIPRLYEALRGSIKIDGIDIRDMTLESLRRQIGMVMQEPYLFNDTIEENLRYSNNDATEAEMVAACKASYIHDFIMTLPDQYRTVVGNRGIKLSGGEKQRVSIARVILKNPAIIILDEATSALDSVSEMFIQKAMLPLMKGRTSFVIAHRLSTVLAADQIFVLENGRIVETGRHEELLAKQGLYKKLYDTQFKSQDQIQLGLGFSGDCFSPTEA